MFETIMAVLRPSSALVVRRAEIPTDPASLFIYFLLLVAGWVIWQGHRTAGRSDGSEDRPSGDEGTSPPPPSSERRRRRAGKKRDPDRINWIS